MNNNDVFEMIKSKVTIKEVVAYFYQEVNNQNKTLCPFHSEKTASFSIDGKENIFKCFGCGEGGDCISFVSKLNKVEQIEAAKLIDGAFKLNLFENNNSKPYKVTKAKNIDKKEKVFESDPNIKLYLQNCIQNISKQNYLSTRGLTNESIKKFKLGYDIDKGSITIPYSNDLQYYQSRSIDTKSFFKPLKEKAGSEPIYNEKALMLQVRTPIFVVESPFCAMSIMQEGGAAIATCGTGCLNKLTESLKKHKPKGALILCFDNDEAGIKATNEISSELKKLNIKHLHYNICPGCKDPNEMLLKDKTMFNELIVRSSNEAKKLTATKYDMQSAKELNKKNIPEPFWLVNEMLTEGLAMISAASKVGKSWLAQQLCITVANGEDFLGHKTKKCATLYLALEDSERRMKSRMQIYLQGQCVPELYNYCIHAKTLDTGLLDDLENYLLEQPTIKLIIIDTLQRVRGVPLKNENAYATDYRELGKLKEFADQHHICVLLLHHVRKMQDLNDAFNQINGTNGMMGVLDTCFIIIKKNRMDTNATLLMTGRDIFQQEFIINKGEKNGRWDIVGTPEEQENKEQREKYNKDPLVILIKELLKRQTSWRGTVKQFKLESIEILREPMLSSETKIGKDLSSLTYELALDGIVHEISEKRSKNGYLHTFAFKNKFTGQAITDNYTQGTLNY